MPCRNGGLPAKIAKNVQKVKQAGEEKARREQLSLNVAQCINQMGVFESKSAFQEFSGNHTLSAKDCDGHFTEKNAEHESRHPRP